MPQFSREVFARRLAAVFLGLGTLLGAEPPAQRQTVQITEGPPDQRGVFVRQASRWVGLHHSLLAPHLDGALKSLVGFGYREFVLDLPGSRAALQISEARPTFFVRGFDSDGDPHLLRLARKNDFREARMPMRGRYLHRLRFKPGDLQGVEVMVAPGGLLVIKPVSDLGPGEYMLTLAPQAGQKAIQLGFDFGVTTKQASGP